MVDVIGRDTVADAQGRKRPALVQRLIRFLGVNRNNLGSTLLTVSVTAFLSIITCVSYPTIIFSGALAPYLHIGIGIGFFSAAVLGAVMAPGSSYPGAVTYAQSQPLVILGLIATSMVAALHATGRDDRILATVLAAIMVGSLAYGAFLLFLGVFRLGNLIRYIPYPVMGGFLAGIGWLMLKAAIAAMAGIEIHYDSVLELFEPAIFPKWSIGLALGVIIRLIQTRRRHTWNLPAMLAAAIAAFWAAAAFAGASEDGLRSSGWLPERAPEGGLWMPWHHLVGLHEAAWDLFPVHIGEFATLAVMSAMALLLSANAIELSTRRDLDLNRELRSAGIANLLCGLGGGLPGYYSMNGTLAAERMNTPIRFVGLATSAICFVALLTTANMVTYIPKLVVGGLLVDMSFGFLLEWLYGGWRRLPKLEFLILLVVFATVVIVGFMQAVILGTLTGVVLFVVRYSQIGVARDKLSGATYRSNVDRAEAEHALLREHGDHIYILRLQGFLFFGTANKLISIVRRRLGKPERRPLRYLIVDFKLVTGMDASAVASFAKLAQYAEDKQFVLVLCSVAEPFSLLLSKDNVDVSHPYIRRFRDLDHALEWAENDLLAGHRAVAAASAGGFDVQIRRIYPDSADAERFRTYCETLSFEAGDVLIRQGGAADDMLFVESGRVAIMLELPSGDSVRLKSMGPGTVVGEIAFYLGIPRSASVVAVEPTVAYRLCAERLRAMQSDDPVLATAFHQYMASSLSAKLVDTNRLVSALNQ